MPISWLFQEPISFIAWLAAVLAALTIHEFSHAMAARLFGDKTAEAMGRLTLNPLSHIDPLGFLMLVFIGFGWAKPVPINPYNLKPARSGVALTALAGPVSNFLAIILFGLTLKLTYVQLGPQNLLVIFMLMLVLVNASLMFFNLLPIPPLDGSKVLFSLLPDKYNNFKVWLSLNGPWVLLALLVADSLFNLNLFAYAFGWLYDLILRIFF